MYAKICSVLLIALLWQQSAAAVLKETPQPRDLAVKSTSAGVQAPERKLEFFKSDEKTREIIKLRKEIAAAEGMIKQYEGWITR
jgi:hypothetical protein